VISMEYNNGRQKNVPLAAWLAPAWHTALLNRSDHLGHGAKFLLPADGEHHEHALSVALVPDSVDAIVTTRKIGDAAVGKAVSHVSVVVDFHADEPSLGTVNDDQEQQLRVTLPQVASQKFRDLRARASLLRL
jgi:L-ascorbate metabolism protein UlaG (beta-lactamase superfamily)